MFRPGLLFLPLLLAGRAFAVSHPSSGPSAALPARPAPLVKAPDAPQWGRFPLSFEANRGQADPSVRFLSGGGGARLLLKGNEAVLTGGRPNASTGKGAPPSVRLRMKLLGARPNPEIVGQEKLDGRTHYLAGKDPKQWVTHVPNYARVRYRRVYPGVDMTYYGHRNQLEYDLLLAPGADPRRILLGFSGMDRLSLDSRGDLLIHTGGGTLRQGRPVVYQRSGGKRIAVAGKYMLRGKDRVAFKIGPYDRTKSLVIDPTLGYAALFGGAPFQVHPGIAVDAEKNVYVAGNVNPGTLPVTEGAYSAQPAALFVAKLKADGSGFAYATYLPAADGDTVRGIAVDAEGGAYVTGSTSGALIPTTDGAYQKDRKGESDAFVLKLSPDGSSLAYGTLLGGSDRDDGNGIAVDPSGNAVVAGSTKSVDFPTTAGVYQADAGGGFVARLNPQGAQLLYGTYLGTDMDATANAVAVDKDGNAYATGFAGFGAGIRTTPGATNQSEFGPSQIWAAKFLPTGGAAYAVLLLGNSFNGGTGIAVDGEGHAFITGSATGIVTSTGVFQQESKGTVGQDAFVQKIPPNGKIPNFGISEHHYSTYVGGSDDDTATGIAIDPAGHAYVTGYTASTDFPAKNDPVQAAPGGGDCGDPCRDVFVTKLSEEGSTLGYSTYLGGNKDDLAYGIAADEVGGAYVVGVTDSDPFLAGAKPIGSPAAGDRHYFVAKVAGATAFKLTAEKVGTTSVLLRWVNEQGANGSYSIEQKSGDGTFKTLGLTDPQSTAFEVKKLEPGKAYTFRVSTSTGSGIVIVSDELQTTTKGVSVGDVNADESVDVGDAVEVLRYIVGTAQFEPWQVNIGDVIQNSAVDVSDAVGVLRLSVGLPPGG